MQKRFFALALLLLAVFLSPQVSALKYFKTTDINITAPASLDLNSQFTMTIDLNSDVTGVVTDNVDLNDLTLFYGDLNLARRVEKYGSNARLYFRIPAGLTISAGTTDPNFKLKYFTDTNVTPFINDANVFLKWFDFNSTIPPNIDSNNAAIVEGSLQIVNGAAWGNSYAFLNDGDFYREWGATIEADVNVGPSAGTNFGFNDGTGTTQNDMNTAIYQSELNITVIQGETGSPSYPTAWVANQFLRLKVTGKSLSGTKMYHGDLTDFDLNQFYTASNPSQNGITLGVTVEPDIGTSINFDNLKMYYDANSLGASALLIDSNNLIAGFSANPSQLFLDQDGGITSGDVNFNSITSASPDVNIVSYAWKINGVDTGLTDENITYTFSSVGDYNVSLGVNGQNVDSGANLYSQSDLNYSVRNLIQGLDINFVYNNFLNNIDVNFGLTSDSSANYVVWGGTDFDSNLSGLVVNKTYTVEGLKQVCVVVNSGADTNSLYCENFVATRFLVKKPLDEDSLIVLTPFTVSGSVPTQTFSNYSSDLNLFAFYQSSDEFRINVDFNASYYPRNYFFDLNSSTFYFEVQPYLVSTTSGIQSVIFTIDNLSRTTISGVIVQSYRDINGTMTLMESGISDASGTVTLSFLTEPTYTLYFILDGNVLSSGNIVAKSTTLYAFIFTGVITTSPTALPKFSVQWFPSGSSILSDADDNAFLNQLISYADTNIFNIHVSVWSNDLNVFEHDFNGLGSGDWNISYDFNVSDVNQFSFLNVRMLITTSSDGNFTFTKTYIVVFSGTQGILNNFKSIKSELGNTSVLILSILISLGVVAFVAMRLTTDPAWLGILAILITGFFVYISWLPFNEWAVAAVGGIALMFWSWRR